jgi:hypothetical protein
MKKWMLILAISCLILMMIGFPGLYDSRRMGEAYRQYRDAPSEQTRNELREARISDRWHIVFFELAFGGVLAASWWALVRVEKSSHESAG